MTPARIRAAAATLRVTYLPVLFGHEGHDWREAVDVSESLADLLDGHASLLEYSPPRNSKGFAKTVGALVEKIEEATVR